MIYQPPASDIIPDKRKQMLELSVFLLFIFPSMVLSFFMVKKENTDFLLTSMVVIARDLALVYLVLYFIWNNRESFSSIGLRVSDPLLEISLGLILFFPFFYGTMVISHLLTEIGLHTPKTIPHLFTITNKNVDVIIATLLVTTVAFSEELLFRGYLIHRLYGITESITWATILSTVIFSLGHGYEGSAGLVTVGAMGLIFAFIYFWRGNLIAAMTIHFLQDFIGIVIIPLAGVKH